MTSLFQIGNIRETLMGWGMGSCGESGLESISGKSQRDHIQFLQKLPFCRLIATFFVHLKRIAPWTLCSSGFMHLSPVFCLSHCTEMANDLLNTKFNSLASVFLLPSHPAAFDSVGFVLLQTLSSLYFTEYIILMVPCVSDYSSLSFNFSSFSWVEKSDPLPQVIAFCFSLTLLTHFLHKGCLHPTAT